MIEFIEGIIEYIGPNFIVIHSGNFAFKVETSLTTLEKLKNVKSKVRLYTYLQIREKDLSLFGFLKREERDLFLLFLTVGGIGPKIGLALLSIFSPEKIKVIIMDEDVDALVKVPGIGKKTAQRMILELKGSIDKGIGEEKDYLTDLKDVYIALESLGYSRSEIKKTLGKLKDRVSSTTSIDEIIKLALKAMDKNG